MKIQIEIEIIHNDDEELPNVTVMCLGTLHDDWDNGRMIVGEFQFNTFLFDLQFNTTCIISLWSVEGTQLMARGQRVDWSLVK